MTSSSAPGKIILFGEHAVVYGRPALAVPVTQLRATATVLPGKMPGVRIDAPQIGLSASLDDLPAGHPLGRVVRDTLSFLGVAPFPAISLKIDSTIPVAAGLGSGAAVSVAVIRALSAFVGQSLGDEQVSALAYEVEKLHHGTPSGIDNSVITHNQPVYFVRGQPIEVLEVGAPFHLVIGDTGVAAPTREAVADVRRLWQQDRPRLEAFFDRIAGITARAREHLQAGNWRNLGGLMDDNHALLRELTVSSPELECLVEAGRDAGALGAKLSGGGRGGNMMALVAEESAPAVAEALSSAGAKQTIITRVG